MLGAVGIEYRSLSNETRKTPVLWISRGETAISAEKLTVNIYDGDILVSFGQECPRTTDTPLKKKKLESARFHPPIRIRAFHTQGPAIRSFCSLVDTKSGGNISGELNSSPAVGTREKVASCLNIPCWLGSYQLHSGHGFPSPQCCLSRIVSTRLGIHKGGRQDEDRIGRIFKSLQLERWSCGMIK